MIEKAGQVVITEDKIEFQEFKFSPPFSNNNIIEEAINWLLDRIFGSEELQESVRKIGSLTVGELIRTAQEKDNAA